MTMDKRQRGWLTTSFHLRFREILLHSLHREDCLCPIYCLMPDHFHLLLMGRSDSADQRRAIRHFRTHLNRLLGVSFILQKQPHDHVLRRWEREQGAFQKIAAYISDNPVRAGLVQDREAWEFSSALIPGYPELVPALPDYWARFWRLLAYEQKQSIRSRSS
jgi:REP element-mobilizing transposase RayT